MSNTSLRREVSVTGNRRVFTFSAWLKKTTLAATQTFFSQYVGSGSATTSTHFRVRFSTSDDLQVAAGGTDLLVTNAVYRDTNAWMHVVCAVDTTQSTADDRVKLYVNGEQITSFATRNNPTQNLETVVNLAGSSHYPRIAADDSDGAGPYNYFDGYMSHVHFIDGTAYPASTFGSTDSVTGQWQLNTAPSITMGTNGFTILKDGNTITDQSANSNDFISLGAGVTNTEDCPNNVFATLNPLNVQSTGYTIANGNLSITANSGNAWRTMYATLGASSGKYYWEQKITNFTGSNPHYIGISDIDNMKNSNDVDFEAPTTEAFGYTKTGQSISKNSLSSYGDSWTTGDIIGVAVDLDNLKIYFSKNGVFQNSSNPANGTNPAYTITSGKTYTATTSTYYSDNQYQMNFGNGFFGTTAISSEGSNASGIGKFEYDVPAGYTALSTKGLNE